MALDDVFDFIMGLPFFEAIHELVTRTPVQADTSQELGERYNRERVFGMVDSASLEMTQQVQDALAEAMRSGIPQDEIEKFVQKRIESSSRRMAETIWRTNFNTATNQGKASAAEKTRGVVGFEFSATGGHRRVGIGTGWGDGSTRENHAKADTLRAPTSHPVWEILFPPLGYNCRCTIREITRAEAERKGWLDNQGKLRPWHYQFGHNVSVSGLVQFGAQPDDATRFGNKLGGVA